MKNFILIGSVESSNMFLEEAIKCGYKPAHVFSLGQEYSANVSGYYPIHETATENDIPYTIIHKVNDAENIAKIKKIDPDFIFVIGISQLISKEVIDCAKEYAIGLHPTKLPKHRGRAAIPWQILLGVKESALTLFQISEGTDDGDIIWQEPYTIEEADYASDVHNKVYEALRVATQKALPKIIDGTIEVKEQNHEDASYLLIRRPKDGLIDWNQPAEDTLRLIRATAKPYPGAYTYYNGEKVIIWEAEIIEDSPYIGINGQIAKVEENKVYVVVRDSLVRIISYEMQYNSKFIVGKKFGRGE